jgi:5-methylcytosine-specific restriction protein A
MTEEPQLELGRYYTREQLVAMLGGSKQNGIAPCAKTDNVLVYTDPKVGEKHGYFDRLNLTDDGPLVEYTGAGQDRDHTLDEGSDNYALLYHREKGRALRLLQAAGRVKGKQQKLHKYLGEYAVDERKPWFHRDVTVKGVTLRTIVFRLRPVGPTADPAIGVVSIPNGVVYKQVHVAPELTAAKKTTCRLVNLERNSGVPIVRKPAAAISVERREGELVDRFQAFIESQGRQAMRYELSIEGLSSMFLTDLYDVSADVLYEAKGRADRNSIRLAIGQLLDYRRHIDPSPKALAILLPNAPDHDLKSLIKSVGIELVYEEDGQFVGWPVGGR